MFTYICIHFRLGEETRLTKLLSLETAEFPPAPGVETIPNNSSKISQSASGVVGTLPYNLSQNFTRNFKRLQIRKLYNALQGFGGNFNAWRSMLYGFR